MVKVLIQKQIFKVLNLCKSGKRDNHDILEGFHITKKHIEVTNGKMLVRATCKNMVIPKETTPGLYKFINVGKKQTAGFVEIILEPTDMKYPDTDAIIPACGNRYFKISICERKTDLVSDTVAVLTLYKKTGHAYAGHLIERLAPLNETWVVNKPEKDKSVLRLDCVAWGEDIIAIILPFLF